MSSNEILLETINLHLKNAPPKLFSSSSSVLVDLRKLRFQLQGVLSTWKSNGIDGNISSGSMKIYDALVYKFGQSNRHQKFWKVTLQVYSELKRINQRNLFEILSKISQGLSNSNYTCAPSTSATCYVASLILERMIRLDRLRLLCVKSAHFSMGYIELNHLITFNLMLIAIASDIAKESLRHIYQLSKTYNELAYWFRSTDKSFPTSSAELQLRSIPNGNITNLENMSKPSRTASRSLKIYFPIHLTHLKSKPFQKFRMDAEVVLEKMGISVPRDDDRFNSTLNAGHIITVDVDESPEKMYTESSAKLKRKRKKQKSVVECIEKRVQDFKPKLKKKRKKQKSL
uniref:Nucleolus and neural progenitor protein-like N-terminal domain-containing protein n=1 Tax=Acrobeloides nanus TaxID=290746 RepID=A0A914CAR8_9BILA